MRPPPVSAPYAVFDMLERKRQRPQARWRAGLNRALQSGSALFTSLLLTIMVRWAGWRGCKAHVSQGERRASCSLVCRMLAGTVERADLAVCQTLVETC